MKELMLNVGFSEKEAELYIALLKIGEGTVDECSSVSGVRRTTAYQIMRKLVEKGIVAELSGKPTRFSPLPPKQAFGDFFDRRLKEIEKIKEEMPISIDKIVRQAEELYAQKRVSVDTEREIMIIRGHKMVYEIVKPIEARVRDCIRILSRPPIVFKYQKNKKPPIGNTNRSHSFIKKVICESDMLKDENYCEVLKIFLNSGNFVRHLPSLPLKLVIYDDFASLVSMTPNGKPEEHIALLVQNKQMVAFHIKSFDMLWETAKQISIRDIE